MPDNNDQKLTTPLSMEAILHARLDLIVTSLGGMTGQLSSLVTSQTDVVVRLDRIEKWKEGVEARLSRNSERVGTTSENDLKQDAAIAKIVIDVEGVKKDVAGARADVALVRADVARVETKTEAQTVLLNDLKKLAKGLAKNPLAIGLLVAASNALTWWLKGLVH